MDLVCDRLQYIPDIQKQGGLSLDYQFVAHNNHEQYLNEELTQEHLQKQADFSETINSPHIFGKFNDEQHYLDTLSFVLSSTHETRNRILFCLNEILPSIPANGSLLDIGPGDGSLTKIIAPHFEHITMVDINHQGLDNVKEMLPSSINITQIIGSVSNIELKSNHYNLAVLSHMLYYIDPQLWLGIIKSVYKGLKENGILVIILGGDEQGKAELIQNFGGETLEIDQLALQCLNTFGDSNVTLHASDESFVTCTQESMLHILGFMLADANITASEDDLNRYITQKLQSSVNHFELTTRQKYIIIKKNSLLMDEPDDVETLFSKTQ